MNKLAKVAVLTALVSTASMTFAQSKSVAAVGRVEPISAVSLTNFAVVNDSGYRVEVINMSDYPVTVQAVPYLDNVPYPAMTMTATLSPHMVYTLPDTYDAYDYHITSSSGAVQNPDFYHIGLGQYVSVSNPNPNTPAGYTVVDQLFSK